ncbi:MAG: inositol monophosphatase, partial [Deltaproteobacteria bacterium]|nr:inositol monophosphatase [Deltaproteobacteria bacterium]
LDGTTSFVHGYPFFAVSIGITHRGRAAAGVVYAPYFDELYVGGDTVPATMNAKPIRASSTSALDRALLATGFAFDRQAKLERLMAPVECALRVAHDIRRAGAASLDLCHVAAGRLDGYFEEGLAPWDVAAGEAIVRAAGGTVTDYRGRPHDLYGRSVLATNAQLHAPVIELLGAAERGRAGV